MKFPHSSSRPGRRTTAVAISLVASVLVFAGCTGTPDGVQAVKDFELERYLGTWYEIARLDHPFERGLTDVTAEYRPREGGGIEVVNSGFDPEAGERRAAVGKAFFVGDPSVGRLKVSFFGPFYGGYNVIALDGDHYCWSMVAGPNRSYLWILGRTPELDPELVRQLTDRAAALDFPVEALIWVDQAQAEKKPNDPGHCAPPPRFRRGNEITLD